MSDGEDPEVSMLRAEVEALKAERDSAVAVLSDFLEERGESWLVALSHPDARIVKISTTIDRFDGVAMVEIGLQMPPSLARAIRFRR